MKCGRSLIRVAVMALLAVSIWSTLLPVRCDTPHLDAVTLNNQAVVLINHGNYSQAIEKLLQALKKEPTYEKGRMNLVLALKQQSLMKDAKPFAASRAVLVALLIDPNNDTLKRILESKIKAQGKDPAMPAAFIELGADLEKQKDRLGAYAAYKHGMGLKFDEALEVKAYKLRKEMNEAGEAPIDLSDECQD